MLWQPSLPESYTKAAPGELSGRIDARRRELGDKLVILGHHYQTDAVIRHADFTGDSLKLSQIAAEQVARRGATHVVFCGVHFMAETADMLTPESVAVILPDLSAGCSMADMADHDETVEAWTLLHAALDELARAAGKGKRWNGRIVPVTYVNSTAAIKAFVGERGGAACTSSNARSVLEWALAGGETPRRPDEEIKVLFLPDQHLGRNTSAQLGINTGTQTALYDPRATARGAELGGMTREQLRDARVLLWAGHCSVHKLFRPEHIEQIRGVEGALPPGKRTKVLVHPECAKEVVDRADLAGSTEYIIRTIDAAPSGSSWAVGTEFHLVARLAKSAKARGVSVRILSDCQCLCTTMYRIDEPHVLWVLDHLVAGRTVNQISVHAKVREPALLALRRMLALTAGGAGSTNAPETASASRKSSAAGAPERAASAMADANVD